MGRDNEEKAILDVTGCYGGQNPGFQRGGKTRETFSEPSWMCRLLLLLLLSWPIRLISDGEPRTATSTSHSS